MLKIGMIGMGDIAGKAYLPVLSSSANVSIHLLSRNQAALGTVAARYRFQNIHHTLDSLIYSGISAAFVHTATSAHFGIVKTLLEHHIHVFVDKPVTLDYPSCKELVELAERNNLILMAGFNRRYAPVYQKLKEVIEPNMILMQKNRQALPGDLRSFIFDDFIHVVDTLRFLYPYPIDQVLVNGMKKDGLLYQVILQLISNNGPIAIGIMNRDSGTTEEKVEVFSTAEKRVVLNLSELTIHKGNNINRIGSSDWEPMLHKRGFEQMIEDFLQAVDGGSRPKVSGRDALLSHELCEIIVKKLQANEFAAT